MPGSPANVAIHGRILWRRLGRGGICTTLYDGEMDFVYFTKGRITTLLGHGASSGRCLTCILSLTQLTRRSPEPLHLVNAAAIRRRRVAPFQRDEDFEEALLATEEHPVDVLIEAGEGGRLVEAIQGFVEAPLVAP